MPFKSFNFTREFNHHMRQPLMNPSFHNVARECNKITCFNKKSHPPQIQFGNEEMETVFP